MRWFCQRKWLTLAVLTVGTTLQLSACREELALLTIRTAFTSITLPINVLIRQFILGLG